MPFTCHVTAVLGLLVTVATNCCAAPAATVADAGWTATTTVAASVTVAVADLEGSAWAVAVTETTAGVGRLAGAAYNPLTLIVPTAASPPVVPFTAQKAAVFELPVTAALNCRVAPVLTLAAVGVRAIAIGVGPVLLFPPHPASVRIATDNATSGTICVTPRFTLDLLDALPQRAQTLTLHLMSRVLGD
jgi:hypothetical protein